MSPRVRSKAVLLASLALVAAAAYASSTGSAAPAQDTLVVDRSFEIKTSDPQRAIDLAKRENLTPGAVTRILKLVELLRSTDLSIANLEFLFHNFEHAWQWTGGTYTRSDPKNLSELKWRPSARWCPTSCSTASSRTRSCPSPTSSSRTA